jgi:hypothetical protein
MKINISKICYQDIEGSEVKEHSLHKTLAMVLYKMAKTLDLVDKAMQMNRGEEIDVSMAELNEIKFLIKDPNSRIYAFARKAMLEYLDEVLQG